jgi:hypothetical protein
MEISVAKMDDDNNRSGVYRWPPAVSQDVSLIALA